MLSGLWIAFLAAALPQVAAPPPGGPRYLIAAHPPLQANAEPIIGIEARSDREFINLGWPQREIRWLFVRGHGVQQNRDTLAPLLTDPQSAIAPTATPGVNMVGLDFQPRQLTRTAAELREELATRAAEIPDTLTILDADTRLTVRYVASAKLLLQLPGETGPDESTVATSKSGQAVEIRPLANPMRLPVGSDFPMRLYADGDKRGDVRIIATHADSRTQRELEVDRGAFANLTLTHDGRWYVEFTHVEPRRDSDVSGADWIVWSATLTFDAAVDVASTEESR